MSLEGALISLLFDACTNYSKDRYLRLHRKMAPYKFAITFDSEGNNYFMNISSLFLSVF